MTPEQKRNVVLEAAEDYAAAKLSGRGKLVQFAAIEFRQILDRCLPDEPQKPTLEDVG